MALMKRSTKAGRRHPLAAVFVVAIGLMLTGGGYAVATTVASNSTDAVAANGQLAEEGSKLFAANCASCHGKNAEGRDGIAPSLVGVGYAAVDFQVGTGRMPGQASGPQLEKKPVQFTEEQTAALATYVASLAPGPSEPAAEYLDGKGDTERGGELFRINCAMCHNAVGGGGALTQGKFAPSLKGVSAKHIYEAMVTGPQNMPVFNDANLTPEDKRDIISYLEYLEENPSAGGYELANLGPVVEGLFIWTLGLGFIVTLTVWLGAKSN